ncbi:hypothetical protein NHJ13734_004384 [Beauveria thailandica]
MVPVHRKKRRRPLSPPASGQAQPQPKIMERDDTQTKILCAEHCLIMREYEPAALLVDNYFDRIHWFMLLFHQHNFRDNFGRLYEAGTEKLSASTSQAGYIAVLLSVCAISLQYTTASQKQALLQLQMDPDNLKNNILTVLGMRLLDILSLGSLEAVQTCVLLGSYYLYQGQPELAWPLCGCGLRIAQALNLHRRIPSWDVGKGNQGQSMVAARQRCWWAVYEIETFCCMLYGFPQSISDSDCDIEELNPHDDCSAATGDQGDSAQPNLLFFKCAMSKLSRIVKTAVTGLYGTHRNLDSRDRPIVDSSSRLRSLIKKVSDLDKKLSEWQDGIPPRLRLVAVGDTTRQLLDLVDVDGNKTESCTEQLFQLQALALKLAYENARILVHRPLLSYKMVIQEDVAQSNSNSRDDPFQRSLQRCRDAALEISRVGSAPIFRQAADTYAATFVALHLFTAGVTLCIMTSLDPLSYEAHESKLGIRRLMEIQAALKSKSIAASQGLDILRRLLSLVMAKEIDNLFDMQSPAGPGEPAAAKKSGNQMAELASSPPRGEPPIVPQSSAEAQLWSCEADLAGGNNEEPCQVPELVYWGPSSGFCENPSMVEALLDLEHAISCPTSSTTDQEHVPTPSGNIPIVGQDQAWIWGWDCSFDAVEFP